MSKIVLKVENLSKQYRLGLVGTGTISHDLSRWWARVRGKEDRYLKIGEVNHQSKGSGKYVWALKDINFEVKQGEVMAIVGKNGSGKSTLFKILSKVTGPTTGRIRSRGRISSLLEVGTGFHPELTGRENVFLSGAILGMKRQEITSKMEEIVAFSGIGRYIDTPVKRYSSGMYVRLAFSVAAHLQSDIMIVDEVLAVGDAEFRQKCLRKMKAMANDGRTILFVSHNLPALQQLCQRGLLLENGRQIMDAGMDIIAQAYTKAGITDNKACNLKTKKEGLQIASFTVKLGEPDLNQPIHFLLDIELTNKKLISLVNTNPLHIDISISIVNQIGSNLINLKQKGVKINKAMTRMCIVLENSCLPLGPFTVSLDLNAVIGHIYFSPNIISFEVKGINSGIENKGKWQGLLFPSTLIID